MKSLPSGWKYSIGLIVSILLLFAANLWVGSVRIPAGAVWDVVCGHAVERESWRFILLESRIPQGITALLCGAALAVSGLMLQTVFSNPLAGPSVLGISSGASLGVACVVLLSGRGLGDVARWRKYYCRGFQYIRFSGGIGRSFCRGYDRHGNLAVLFCFYKE